MKQRVISGVVIAVVTIALVLIGGIVFNIAVIPMGLFCAYEFISSRSTIINYNELIPMGIYFLLVNIFPQYTLAFTLLLVLTMLTISIFRFEVTFDLACITIVESIILALSFLEMREVEAMNRFMLGYFIIIAYITDVFALFTGMSFGKHKLNERISPKKTIEGAVGGWAMGMLFSLVWAAIFGWFDLPIGLILICSILLPIVSQIGDLAFSLIKRHFGTKDFSQLIPGHGGLLDRLDSLLFTLLIFRAIFIFFN